MTANGCMSKWEMAEVVAKLMAENCSLKITTPIYSDIWKQPYIKTLEELFKHMLLYVKKRTLDDIVQSFGFDKTIKEMRNDYIVQKNIERDLVGKKPIPFVK